MMSGQLQKRPRAAQDGPGPSAMAPPPAKRRAEVGTSGTDQSSPPTNDASSVKDGAIDEGEDYRDQDFYEPVKFGEFGKYMRNKRRKLKVQNAALLEDGNARPQIFKNLRVYVNGFTESITLPELTELLVRHGGEYVPYLDKKGLVTHIIATNLTPSKRKEFAKYKVATPNWLVESAEQGRLLDWREYSLLGAKAQYESGATFGEGTLASEEAARLGTQTGQRSLFSMGVGGHGKPPAGSLAVSNGDDRPTASTSGRPPHPTVSTCKNVETRESLAERGARLAREALRAQAAGPLHSFFAQSPGAPNTGTIPASTSKSVSVELPAAPTRPITPAKSTSTLPATTDSPTKPNALTRSWLPSKERNERTAALLKDEDWLAKHTSASPDFLAGYFAQSRLHWISSFKEELKDLIATKQQGKDLPKRRGKLTGGAVDGRTIIHVDFDCFFVSAGLTSRPELRGKPVAVCHARGKGEAASSTSEIASCSYEARAAGVRNGMSLGRARDFCPEIQTMPFEFELYRSITLKFYEILLSHAAYIQVVSMDECLAEVDVPPTIFRDQDPALDLARRIRREVYDATGCQASIGISHNILLARLAMRKAKPANIFHLFPEDVDEFLLPLDVDALPGIGWSLREKLQRELGIKTIRDLRQAAPAKLADAIGRGNSKKFTSFAFGVDDAELESQKLRQSVSTEVNYGIRFGPGRVDQVERFVRELGDETAKRLRTAGLKARQIVLHVMIRHPDAPVDTPKFLGHGHVNQENRTSALSGSGGGGGATDDGGVVGEVAWRLMSSIGAPAHELRGIGIQLTKLERDGVSVETVHEKGQSRLFFKPRAVLAAAVANEAAQAAVVSSSTNAEIATAGSRVTSGPAKDRPTRRDVIPPAAKAGQPDTLVLDSDSSEAESRPDHKHTRGMDMAATRLRPRSRQSSRSVEPYIPTMFKPTKKSARAAPKSASQAAPEELLYYGIDPETFMSFDRALQAEILADARRSKPPPGKAKTKNARKTAAVAPTKQQSAPPEIIVLPASPAEVTDSQIRAMQYDPEIFRELGKATQAEQVELHRARQARTVTGDRTARLHRNDPTAYRRNRPPVKDVTVRPPPRFQGQTELSGILDRLELWMGTATDRAPDRGDVDALGRYIEKCAARERGHNLAQATEVMQWWRYLIDSTFPPAADRPDDGGIEGLWRSGYQSVVERLDRVVEKATGQRLRL